MKKYIFMTVMSMILAGTAFAQTTANVTALHCDKTYFLENWSYEDSVIHKDRDEMTIWAIPYEGGNGGIIPDSETYGVASYGVEGLWIFPLLYPLEIGDGYLKITIGGRATSSGIAQFNVTLGGKSCVVKIPVLP